MPVVDILGQLLVSCEGWHPAIQPIRQKRKLKGEGPLWGRSNSRHQRFLFVTLWDGCKLRPIPDCLPMESRLHRPAPAAQSRRQPLAQGRSASLPDQRVCAPGVPERRKNRGLPTPVRARRGAGGTEGQDVGPARRAVTDPAQWRQLVSRRPQWHPGTPPAGAEPPILPRVRPGRADRRGIGGVHDRPHRDAASPGPAASHASRRGRFHPPPSAVSHRAVASRVARRAPPPTAAAACWPQGRAAHSGCNGGPRNSVPQAFSLKSQPLLHRYDQAAQ